MQTKSFKPDQKSVQNQEEYIPFDGFVNVNDIVRKRRQLRNAQFNVSDQSWDSALNLSAREGDKSGTDGSKSPSL